MRSVYPILAIFLVAALATQTQAALMVRDDSVDAVVIERASILYGRDVSVQPAADPAFAAAFPKHDLYAVWEKDEVALGAHLMAFNRATSIGFDVTREYNALLSDAGAVIADPDDALRFAEALAQVANGELQLGRQVVGAADSARLGRSVTDPAATPLLDGWSVRLTTWAEENGVVADWTMRFTFASLTRAQWRVAALATGDYKGDFEATNFRVGTSIVNRYPTSGYVLEAFQETSSGTRSLKLPATVAGLNFQPITERANFDGSIWRALYPSAQGATTPVNAVEIANAMAEGAVRAYNTQVARGTCAGVENPGANWGFTSKDRDCVLEIRILDNESLMCLACTPPSEDMIMYIAPYLKEGMQSFNYYTNEELHDIYAIARAVAGHEHFHNLQYAISQWDPRWGSWLEGQARFQETILTPVETQDPSSPWYVDSAIYMDYIDYPLCQHAYSLAPYWGFLYWKDGGIATLRRHLEELPEVRGTSSCNSGMSLSITGALEASPGAHDHQHDALLDMAVHAYRRDLVWGDPTGANVQDWGSGMKEPYQVWHEGQSTYDVGAYGIHYAILPAEGAYTVTCGGPGDWSFRLLLTDAAGALTVQPVDCAGTTVNGGAWSVVRFNAVRLLPESGTYALGIA